MRLKRIRLSGFKSFVEPTTFELPSAMVGVAGPNGAGKSNLIDAVRWVMGESSAKQLRGGQMTDVIFNGSSGRKPVGTASVEIVFDNTKGRLGGEFAKFSEISIRRVVDREGISNYYLNGTRCRRRDVVDVFLGTGLGPRSYALIEQGTISRLVESKPEELREFLEEAAGISRYKERRRETENRLSHTRENMERVNDLREEVQKHLNHLKRQARSAERYKELRAEQSRLKSELIALELQRLEADLSKHDDDIRESTLAIERQVTRRVSVERELSSSHEDYETADARLKEQQQRFFAQQTKNARLEEAIAGASRERRLHEDRIVSLRNRLDEIQNRIRDGDDRLSALGGKEEEVVSGLKEHDIELQKLEVKAEHAGEEESRCQEQYAERREQHSEVQRRLAVAESEERAIADRERRLLNRREKLLEEQATWEKSAGSLSSHEAREATIRVKQSFAQAEMVVSEVEGRLDSHRVALATASSHLAEIREESAHVNARLDALKQLTGAQQSGDAGAEWLKDRGLSENQTLAAALDVAPGWEAAVEIVIGGRLKGIEASRSVEQWLQELRRYEGGEMTLVNLAPSLEEPNPRLLSARVSRRPTVIDEMLAQVFAAEDLNEAVEQHKLLDRGQSVITREGIWMGREWIYVPANKDGASGLIVHEQERERLSSRYDQLHGEVVAQQHKVDVATENVREAENKLGAARLRARQLHQELAEAQAVEADRIGRERNAKERLQSLEEEIQALGDELIQVAALKDASRERLTELRQRLLQSEDARQREKERFLNAQQTASSVIQEAQTCRQSRVALALKFEALQAQRQATLESNQQLLDEQKRLKHDLEAVEELLSASEGPAGDSQEALASGLLAIQEIEAKLKDVRNRVEIIGERVRELEAGRRSIAEHIDQLKESLGEVRVAAQDLRTRREGLLGQFRSLGCDYSDVLREISPGANIPEWTRQLDQLDLSIQRLGAINLAAIDELADEEERAAYLEHQHTDLAAGIQTLERAIENIDRETRSRFSDTFEHVNKKLNALFPRLFGGGSASLVMTGTNLLDAGVVVTARPPGKRNASIHALSGGEKALVAVALVFAIFDLNPAPFCMLDEVDAPMDDANVERFCELVRELSQSTQFVLITHNRHSMAACHQLIGVTMQEPGVSRLVGVDLDEVADHVAN